ncbi:MAG TPA: hypothetical protein VHY84_16725 [Bryobacteraceae bacterium]|jgi:hypothetical protein|nr:hypothetical protein [Bryobacteraceae bacterium]
MMTRVYLAILWAGARIVRERERAEWLAEWQTELWYAMQGGDHRRSMSFCLGSLRDALWKRRNSGAYWREGSILAIANGPGFPDPPAIECTHLLESPFRCLALLGVLAAVAIFLSLVVPTPAVFPDLPGFPTSGGRFFVTFLPACAVFWPIAAFTSDMVGGEYPRHRNWLRRWCFCVAKVVLLWVIVAFTTWSLVRFSVALHIVLGGDFMAMRWAMMDQRRRCPTCLRILDKPVRMGSRSRILLEWSGTELLCLRGHGVMHVPESPAIWFTKQRWMSLS